MADLYDPTRQADGQSRPTEVVQTAGPAHRNVEVVVDGPMFHSHTHHIPKPAPDMAYTERQLVALIRMMKSAVIGLHHELDIIAANAAGSYPEFSTAVESFVKNAKELNESRQQGGAQRDLFERLYAAEQLKTQAMMEALDI